MCVACSFGDGDNRFYTEWNEATQTFEDMNLHENLLRGIFAYGRFPAGSCPFICEATRRCPHQPIWARLSFGLTCLYDHEAHTGCSSIEGSVNVYKDHAVWGMSFLCPFCSADYEQPSAVQQLGIVPFGKGLDLIVQAPPGTGKTATFCTGILQNLDYSLMECQGLVLAPTREQAQQTERLMRALGDYLQVRLFT